MAMPERDPQERQRSDRRAVLADVMEKAVRHYRLQLRTGAGPGGAGLSCAAAGSMRQRWNGGKSGSRRTVRQGLFRHLTEAGIAADLVVDAGLAARPDDGGAPYDRFRGRIIFPIRDARGRCIALGGRAMDPNARAKYLNSPETALFDKGRSLYNHGPAREAAGKGQPLVVAEGYMDVIALVEAGFGGAVAPLGTAITEDQLQLHVADPPGARGGAGWGHGRSARGDAPDRPGVAADRGGAIVAVLPAAGGARPRRCDPGRRRHGDAPARRGAPSRWSRYCGVGRPRAAVSTVPNGARRSTATCARRCGRSAIHRSAPITAKRFSASGRTCSVRAEARAAASSGVFDVPFTPPVRRPAHRCWPDPAGRSRRRCGRGSCWRRSWCTRRFCRASRSELERLAPVDANHRAVQEALLAEMGRDAGCLRARLEARLGRSALEKLFAPRHVHISPPVRCPDDDDLAALCLAEELAKLEAHRSARVEIAEAVADLDDASDEGVTWRLGPGRGGLGTVGAQPAGGRGGVRGCAQRRSPRSRRAGEGAVLAGHDRLQSRRSPGTLSRCGMVAAKFSGYAGVRIDMPRY